MLRNSFQRNTVYTPDPWLGSQRAVYAADTALVVIDPQLEVCTSNNRMAVSDALDVIDKARKYFSQNDMPVFIVYAAKGKGPMRLPDYDAHINGENPLYRQELKGVWELCSKWAHSAFRERGGYGYDVTGRAHFHRTLTADYPNVKNLVMTGFNLGVCVSETARDARELDYNVTVVADGCENGFSDVPHDFDFDLRRSHDMHLLTESGVKIRTWQEIIDERSKRPAAAASFKSGSHLQL